MKLKINHNLDDVQLEEYLEKALSGLQSYNEPNRDFPDSLANELKEESVQNFDKVMDSMLEEIKQVIEVK